jgi:hypothetical protein
MADASAVTPVVGSLISIVFAAFLLVSALLWYKYTVRYQERIRAKLPNFLLRSSSDTGPMRRWFSPEFTRNSGAVLLVILSVYVFILGIRDLIS